MTHEPAWKRVGAVVLPVLAGLAVYGGALDGEFVWDDRQQVVANPWIQDARHLPKLLTRPVWTALYEAPTNYYRPVQVIAYAALWLTFGGDPLPFHAASLLFHLGTVAVLSLLVLRLTRSPGVAGTAALLFAVHPAGSEAVAWIGGLPELTYAFSVTVALLLVAGSLARSWTAPIRWVALLAGALACFSKETGLVVVPLVFLLSLWLSGTAGRATERLGAVVPSLRSGWRSAVVTTTPFAAVAALYLVARWLVLRGVEPKPSPYGPLDALQNAPALLLSYGKLLLWPFDLSAYHVFEPLPTAAHPAFVLGLALAIGALGGILVLCRPRPVAAFAVALACLPLLPALWVPAVGSNVFAERYAYLPAAGFAWALVLALDALARRFAGQAAGRWVVAAAVLVSVPLGWATARRTAVWHDEERLARSVLERDPRARPFWLILGNHYLDRGMSEEALSRFEAGLVHFPDDPSMRANRTLLRLRLGSITADQAIAEYRELITDDPGLYELLGMLGDACLRAERWSEAESAYLRALRFSPHDKMLHHQLAVVYAATGRIEEARRALERALEIDPDFALARDNLARLPRPASP